MAVPMHCWSPSLGICLKWVRSAECLLCIIMISTIVIQSLVQPRVAREHVAGFVLLCLVHLQGCEARHMNLSRFDAAPPISRFPARLSHLPSAFVTLQFNSHVLRADEIWSTVSLCASIFSK